MTDPITLSATAIAQAIRDGDLGAKEVLDATLSRIDEENPQLNAIVARMDDEARATAHAIDSARLRGDDLPPLAGVPVTVKVNVDQMGQATTNGLRLQSGLIGDEDNPVVANLRRAGAVIVGRTNTPAFSLRWFTRNSLHGQTLNPYDALLTPGGSSGGAGAAVAAGMGAIAHGTDIAGSIRYPAYACGVHGLRPSLGRVPAFNATAGDRHIGGQLMAVSGPLARTIPDLRLAFTAMAAPDLRDPWFMPVPLVGPPAHRRVALIEAPDGMAVATEVRTALHAAAAQLQAQGWEVDIPTPPPLREGLAVQIALWMADMRRIEEAVLREDDPDARFIYDQFCRISPALSADGLMDALRVRSRLVRLWRQFFEEWPLVLCPVSGAVPFANNIDVRSPEDFDQVIEAQLPQIVPPLMGLPGLAVTTDLSGPTPMGVQFLAAPFREDLLLAAGQAVALEVPPIRARATIA
ncbi:amidase [Fuscovulum ytuae]|uniref:Amidase n=1 Tax=Fuscovulum ytuae TaxID=3042299 RepID=A0ABY8QDS6_9RHOB|nr:amidase [Fuscovulum sp. YMD61]WGV18430.1 amidase [Fuscovulum sp. YMD61]